jgi:hypothetical protein
VAIVSSPNKPYYKALFCRSFFLYLLVINHMFYVIDLLLSWGTLQTLLWSHLTCFLVSEICRKILSYIFWVTSCGLKSKLQLSHESWKFPGFTVKVFWSFMGFFSLLIWKLADLTPVSGNGGTFWQMIFELNVNVCMRSWMYTLHSHGLETTEPSLDCFEGLANEPLAIY